MGKEPFFGSQLFTIINNKEYFPGQIINRIIYLRAEIIKT
jgi:hypothetical protein